MRSRLGVSSSSLPAQPMAHAPWSSLSMKMMFGVCGSVLANVSPFRFLCVVEFLPVDAELSNYSAKSPNLQIMVSTVRYQRTLNSSYLDLHA